MAVRIIEVEYKRVGQNLVESDSPIVGVFDDENKAQAWIHEHRGPDVAKMPRELRSTFRIVPA